MASFSRREVITKHVEFLVPIGDAIGEFNKAYNAAANEWMDQNNGRALTDDWARLDTDDENVIIRFSAPVKKGEAKT